MGKSFNWIDTKFARFPLFIYLLLLFFFLIAANDWLDYETHKNWRLHRLMIWIICWDKMKNELWLSPRNKSVSFFSASSLLYSTDSFTVYCVYCWRLNCCRSYTNCNRWFCIWFFTQLIQENPWITPKSRKLQSKIRDFCLFFARFFLAFSCCLFFSLDCILRTRHVKYRQQTLQHKYN